jgi:hypothetical protein
MRSNSVDAHEQETQNCASPKALGSHPSTAIEVTGKESLARGPKLQPSGGLITAVKTNTVFSPTVLTAGKGGSTNFDFKTMPVDSRNPFSKFVGTGAVVSKDDGEASDEEDQGPADKSNNKDANSPIIGAAIDEQTLTEVRFKLKPIKLSHDSPKLASPIVTADITKDLPAVRGEKTAIDAADDPVTSKEDEVYESSDSNPTVPGEVSSPTAPARRSMPTSSSTTIGSVAGIRELSTVSTNWADHDDELDIEPCSKSAPRGIAAINPDQEPVFIAGSPPTEEARTDGNLPSEFAPAVESPNANAHAYDLLSVVDSRSQDLPMITSKLPAASEAYRLSFPSEKTAEEELLIGSEPSKATVTPKATPLSTPKLNPRTLDFKASNLIPLVGLETSKESQEPLGNEVTDFSAPKSDGTEHSDEGISATKSSNAKADVHKAAKSAKPTDDSGTLQQQASPSTELSEHGSPADGEEAEDKAVPDKGCSHCGRAG